jgi:hypothetical protein
MVEESRSRFAKAASSFFWGSSEENADLKKSVMAPITPPMEILGDVSNIETKDPVTFQKVKKVFFGWELIIGFKASH